MFEKDRYRLGGRKMTPTGFIITSNIVIVLVAVAFVWWLFFNQSNQQKSRTILPHPSVAPAVMLVQKVASKSAVLAEKRARANASRAKTTIKKVAKSSKLKHRVRRAFVKKVRVHTWHKKHSHPHQWKHWGAAPFALSFTKSCRKAAWAIDHSSMPRAVKEHFKKVLAGGCHGGKDVWYTPGTTFRQMTSGSDDHHHRDWVMNNVTVAVLPVTHSPKGRLYRKGSVAETAKGREWRWTHDGKIYAWTIFYVCGNEAWRIISTPTPVCATVTFRVQPGDTVRFAVLTDHRLPASDCWQLRDGTEISALPSPCDTCSWIGPRSVIPRRYKPLYTGLYTAHFAQQTLRFPVEVKQEYTVLCVTREGLGESDSWIIQPKEWTGKKVVRVPYGGQKWPVWGPGAINGAIKLIF